jgi:hypothetical protein
VSRLQQAIRRWVPSYAAVFDLFSVYYSSYGGTKSIIRSPYLHLSILVTAITVSTWTKPGWWDLPISILPNLIGFTLSGYAVLMTFGNERFKAQLVRPVPGHPAAAFMAINATFFHFLVLQIIALLIAVIAKSRPLSFFFGADVSSIDMRIFRTGSTWACWCAGYCIFLYAVTLALAAASAVFRVGRWFEWSMTSSAAKDQGDEPP